MLLVALATLVGASMASATGFGFALVLSPAVFAVLKPDEAVTTLLVLGLALNLLLLFGPAGRPAAVRWRAVSTLLIAALPGLAFGVLLLGAMSQPLLQVVCGVMVIAAAISQMPPAAGLVGPRPAGPESRRQGELSLRSACVVGLASGTLTTSTTLSGPPIALWLQANDVAPGVIRASLAASFLGLCLAGGAVLAIGGRLSLDGKVVAPLLGLTVLGHLVGASVFRRLDPVRLRSMILALVLVAGLASLAAGLAGAA